MTPLLIVKIVGLIVGAVASIGGARKDSNAVGEKRWAILLAVLGFGVAVVAELVDTSQKQQAAIETTNRNNALLAEVQRTLHPLFPLSVDVRFRASLSGNATRAFRTALEQRYQHEHSRYPDDPIVWLHPEESDFPTCKKDPVAFQIVSAELGSTVRLYSRQRTKDGRFEQADVDFCPCPRLRDIPSGKGLAISGNEDRRRRITNRDYLFSYQGLYMRDGGRKIDFVDSKNTTDMVSVDDMLGATLEIATQPIDPSEDYCRPVVRAQTEWITFAGVAITLPGWRQLIIDRQMFTPIGPSNDSVDWMRYRFTIPEKKNEFEKLIRDEPPWVAARRP